MRKFIQILLFLISYIPLYLILFLQNLNVQFYDHGRFIGFESVLSHNITSIALLTLILISVSFYWILFKVATKISPVELQVKTVYDNHDEHLSYLATYILPFVGLKFDTWQNLLATIALFFVLGHIYIRTNLILTNPTLTLFQFSISKIEVEGANDPRIVIHRKPIVPGRANLIHIDKSIYLSKQT